ncbi:CDK5 regulatory subunit-associated protein 2-like isoform X1 [Stylophora pistillata]|uniref:CDK5 regulatory subunit-associated protein 2-like isoform X1 n=2 Tax=Stylophora pistillata TaxID=50429 RepID=UPI000C042DCD|nr:CDK5 regulatory subunit-associated protein 2-like isoform X1 [Stylophora pistillata]
MLSLHVGDQLKDSEEKGKMQSYRSIEQLEALAASPSGITIKDHETLIQELKKENFDLKLRLYMEQKERERVTEEFKQKIVVLESDLTEALDELSDALDREKDFEAALESSQMREKALLAKQRRMEETCREQENEIQFLTLTKKDKDKEKEKEKPHVEAQTAEVGTMTDFPFYSERAVDVGSFSESAAFSEVDLKDSAESPNPSPTQTEQRPEGVDLLNTGTLLRKKDMIMREAKRRRTARSKKGQRRNVAGKYDTGPEYEKERARAERKSFFNKLCCCVKQQSAEYEVDPDYEYEKRSRMRRKK